MQIETYSMNPGNGEPRHQQCKLLYKEVNTVSIHRITTAEYVSAIDAFKKNGVLYDEPLKYYIFRVGNTVNEMCLHFRQGLRENSRQNLMKYSNLITSRAAVISRLSVDKKKRKKEKKVNVNQSIN